MYSEIYFNLMIIGKIGTLLWVIFGIYTFITIVFTIAWASEEFFDGKGWMIFTMVIINGLLLIPAVGMPTKTEMLTIVSLKQVDKYNLEHPESIYKPEVVLEGVEDILNKVSKKVDKILGE
jgi:hypothetical protein